MTFKFEKLEVWQQALDYIDMIYDLANGLPPSEEYNLKSQIVRAATSVALNIAEGSTGQTDAEQARFLGMAIRSLIETVACLRIMVRRKLIANLERVEQADGQARMLAAKLHVFRRSLTSRQNRIGEQGADYLVDSDP